MKNLVCLLAAMAGVSAFAGLGDALDCGNLTFETGGNAGWVEQSSVVYRGGSALRSGAIADNQSSWIQTTPTADGMITFRWKVSSESECDTLEVAVGDDPRGAISGTADGWIKKSVVVSAGQAVRWRYSKDSGDSEGLDCGWLDAVEWLPAPSKITVKFETNGGSAIGDRDVDPGTTYEDLPVPEREGDCAFGGWYLDADLTEKCVEEDPIVYNDVVTLYAKWLIPVSVVNTDTLEFRTYDDERLPWEALEGEGASGGYALRGPIDPSGMDGELWTSLPSAGTLTFKCKIGGPGGSGWRSSFDCNLGVGEDSRRSFYYYQEFGVWKEYAIPVYEASEIQWHSCGRSAALYLSDFTWTPAPAAMTVTFDANGGTVNAGAREYVPGETYDRAGEEALPVPTRKNYTFLGWHVGSMAGAKVVDSDKVLLAENVVLVAKWGQAVSASLFGTATFTNIKTSGSDKWYMVDDPDIGKAAEVELKGKKGEFGFWFGPTSSSMQATTTAAGYLAFKWSLVNGSMLDQGYGYYPSADITFYLDGKEVEWDSVWGASPATSEKQVFVYIPAGKHTMKWVVSGRRALYSYQDCDWDDELDNYVCGDEIEEYGSEPLVRVWGFEFEAAGKQPSLQAWSEKVKKYGSWRTGDLARFAAEYKTSMIADPSDYKARILYAVTRLGVLAENKQFTDYAKTFGFTVDWARLSVTPPEPKFDKKSAAVNTMVNKTIALATPAIRDAQNALSGIPEDWDGTVVLSADEWPIDETVSIDAADVQFALAGLDAALAGLNYLGAYDLTANWPKVQATVNFATKVPVVNTVPKIGDAAGWEKTARNFRTMTECSAEAGTGVGAMAVSGTTLSLRLGYDFAEGWLNESNQVREVDFNLKSGDIKLNVWCAIHGENGMWEKEWSQCGPVGLYYTNGGAYGTKTNVSCWVWNKKSDVEVKVPATVSIRGNALVLTVNMAKVNLGTKKKPVGFAKKSWSVSDGRIGVGTWTKVENEEWFEPYYDDDSESWVSPDTDLPHFYYLWTENGTVHWDPLSDAERRVLKFINEQTAMFSKVRDAARLSASRRQFESALNRALAADVKARARGEGGPLHFFEYDPENMATIDFARNNTERALQALNAPTDVDFAAVADEWDATGISTNKLLASEYDYTLLPGGGTTSVFLGALFRGGITRAMLPPMRTNAYGEIVPDFDAMQDPTIGGLFPEMTHEYVAALSGRFESKRDLDHGEWTDPESLPKPGERLTFTYAQYKGYAVSGLPKGWTWNAKTGVLSGTAGSTFTATFTKKGKPSGTVTVEVGAKPAVLLFSDNENAVAITGTGLYNVGATAKAVAAVKSGYAFGGWYDTDGRLVSANAAYSFKMTREDVVLMARTLPLDEDFLGAKPADYYELDVGEDCGGLTPFYVYSGTPFAVSVSGLPAGMAWSCEMEDEGDRFVGDTRLTGAPTKAGVYYVTLTAKNNGGFRKVHVVKIVVGGAEENLPNTANINWDNYAGQESSFNDWDFLETGVEFEAVLAVPASTTGSAPKSVVSTKTVNKKKTDTLPSGLKATLKNGMIYVSGVPSVPGKFTIEFTVTYANKKTAKSAKTVVVSDLGSVYIPTGVIDNDPAGAVRGTATGGGVKHYGQTVKFVATPTDKKKQFFAGWYLDRDMSNGAGEALPGVDYRAATLSAQLGEDWCSGDGMYARFVTKAEEAAEGVEIDCEDFWRVYNADSGEVTQLPIDIVSTTKPTLSAKGLPAGTKLSGKKLVVSKASELVPGWYTVTLTAKTAAGNTATKKVTVLVPNSTEALDKGLLSGLYTGDDGYTSAVRSFMKAGVKQAFTLEDLGVYVEDGWTLAVTGLPKGWTYNAGTKTFSGVATKVGKTTVTFTVTKKSGKKVVASYNATATFDLDPLPAWAVGTYVCMYGKAVVRMDVASNGSISGYRLDTAGKKTFAATGFASNDEGTVLSATLAGKGVSIPVAVGSVENLGVAQGRAEFGSGAAEAFNSPWRLDGADPLPLFADGCSAAIPVGSGTLTLSFDNKGVVTCKYQVGKNATSGSTQICDLVWNGDNEEWTATAAVALVAKVDSKKKVLVPALVRAVPLRIGVDGEGNATVEILAE